jgi:phosphomannomutase
VLPLCDGGAAAATEQDKDGVCAAAVFAEMAGVLSRRGLTVAEHLEVLYRTYGYFLTNNRYVFVDDPRKTVTIFTRLRNEGARHRATAVLLPWFRLRPCTTARVANVCAGHYWKVMGRFVISAIRDLTGAGIDTTAADLRPKFPTSSSSQMITYTFSNG